LRHPNRFTGEFNSEGEHIAEATETGKGQYKWRHYNGTNATNEKDWEMVNVTDGSNNSWLEDPAI